MIARFVTYFFKYIFFAKTRQRLLVLALAGLFISSFSLLVLQSTMGGLQNSLKGRSKSILGHGKIFFTPKDQSFIDELLIDLKSFGIEGIPVFEQELLVRNGNYISPVRVFGFDQKYVLPTFLAQNEFITYLGRDLAIKLKIFEGENVQLISPSHTDPLLGDIPRQVTTSIDQLMTTDLPEVDLFSMWTRIEVLQNLIRAKNYNRILIFQEIPVKKLKSFFNSKFGNTVQLKTWEDQHSTLVWALALENFVMIFLFSCMTLLVSMSITSGFLIFFNKVRTDFITFWVLGSSKKSINKMSNLFLHLLSITVTSFGIFCAFIFLTLLDQYGGDIMPDVFVDRKIPVLISMRGLLFSFLVPYLIAVVFGHISMKIFARDQNSFVTDLRSS